MVTMSRVEISDCIVQWLPRVEYSSLVTLGRYSSLVTLGGVQFIGYFG